MSTTNNHHPLVVPLDKCGNKKISRNVLKKYVGKIFLFVSQTPSCYSICIEKEVLVMCVCSSLEGHQMVPKFDFYRTTSCSSKDSETRPVKVSTLGGLYRKGPWRCRTDDLWNIHMNWKMAGIIMPMLD